MSVFVSFGGELEMACHSRLFKGLDHGSGFDQSGNQDEAFMFIFIHFELYDFSFSSSS